MAEILSRTALNATWAAQASGSACRCCSCSLVWPPGVHPGWCPGFRPSASQFGLTASLVGPTSSLAWFLPEDAPRMPAWVSCQKLTRQCEATILQLKALFYVVPEFEAMGGSYREADQWISSLVQPCEMEEVCPHSWSELEGHPPAGPGKGHSSLGCWDQPTVLGNPSKSSDLVILSFCWSLAENSVLVTGMLKE